MTTATSTSKPSHTVYFVRKVEGRDKAFWDKIGAAWPQKDGKGFSVRLHLLPFNVADGDIIIRVNEDKPGDQE